MVEPREDEKVEQEKPTVKLHGVVEKIVPSNHSSQTEKAQIAIQEADDLYKEIRITNALRDGSGEQVKLQQGTEVDVIVEAPDTSSKRIDGEKSENKQN